MSTMVDTSATVFGTPGEFVDCCSDFASFFGKSNGLSTWLAAFFHVSLFQLPASEEGSEVEGWVLPPTKTNISGPKCSDAA